MSAFSISVQDAATPELQALASVELTPDLLKVGGESLADLMRSHFDMLEETRPNKQGWPRRHFWQDASRSVQGPFLEEAGARVTVGQVGVAQRFFGGVIRPNGHPFLSIPAREEAADKTPREFDNLVVVMKGPDHGELVESSANLLRSGKKGFKDAGATGGLAYFWLVREVDQEADPTVLPTEAEMEQSVAGAITTRIERLKTV